MSVSFRLSSAFLLHVFILSAFILPSAGENFLTVFVIIKAQKRRRPCGRPLLLFMLFSGSRIKVGVQKN
jgi:hypothetical protein